MYFYRFEEEFFPNIQPKREPMNSFFTPYAILCVCKPYNTHLHCTALHVYAS